MNAKTLATARGSLSWPAARLVEIWNGLPGETPVRKFKDRATAVSRIWKAIQSLDKAASVPADEPKPISQTLPVADHPEAGSPAEVPETTPVTDQATGETTQPEAVITESAEPAVSTPVAPQAPDVASTEAPAKTNATRTKKAPTAATNAGPPREGSKTAQVITMLKRKGGVRLKDLMTEMGWQSHSTRALMSAGGSLAKKYGLTVVSIIGENGDRIYSINA